MLGIITAGLSGMQALGKVQDATAHRIANAGTSAVQRRLPETATSTTPGGLPAGPSSLAPEPEVDLAAEVVRSQIALRGYQMSAGLVSVGDELLGSLLDTFA